MIYIKILSGSVLLGGQVANQQMLEDGWIPYEGSVPEGSSFMLVNNQLVATKLVDHPETDPAKMTIVDPTVAPKVHIK